ncbi:MAG: T9SS type A sorting domain-containing protein, partial [Nonlabens sp.]|nr:T9SS type A sorting domain-containing protein [Nonlabens sp.]
NNDGIIQVESGILNIQSSNTNFINGTYNVFTGATMNWNTPVNPSGTLTGTLAGDLNWNNAVNVVAGTYAAVNFAATDHFNWLGTLSGGGTLTNVNVINFRVNNSFIINATTLDNDGVLNFLSSGNLFLNQNSVLNNLTNGVIDFKSDSNSLSFNVNPVGIINNSGLIKKSTGMGVSGISPSLNNAGIIDVQSGEIEHTGTGPFVNQVSGIVQGTGIFDLPAVANFTNNGTFAPGGSPGILTVQGDYKSEASSFIQLEINGQTAGTQHDVLNIVGNNITLNGSINVVLGYAPQLNDEFIVVTTDSIAQCNLPAQVTTDFNGMQYTFSVICNPGNVTLKVTNITLGTADVVFANTKVFPNPTTGTFTIALAETVPEIQVTVTNMLGQTMMSERFNNTNMLQLDLQGSAGMYLVNLNDGQGNAHTIRVVKH